MAKKTIEELKAAKKAAHKPRDDEAKAKVAELYATFEADPTTSVRTDDASFAKAAGAEGFAVESTTLGFNITVPD